MAKKSWLNLLRKLFIWETQPRQEKIHKRRTWMFGRVTVKMLPSLTAPSTSKDKQMSEAEGGQSKHSLTIAIAAEAAPYVVEEVARLTDISESNNGLKEKEEEKPAIVERIETTQSICLCHKGMDESAAIKIQAAFRAYLARKALRALKGIVKLQGIIRGRLVRRKTASTLKSLQSIVSIQSQVCARRFQQTAQKCNYDENEEKLRWRAKIIMMDSIRERRWDDSVMSKEESDVSYVTKKEAMIKRERIKEYAFRHRKSAETERSKMNGRWRYWLEQWVDTQLSKSKEFEDLDSVVSSNGRLKEEDEKRQLRLRKIQRGNVTEELPSPTCMSRKSQCQRKPCTGVDNSTILSPEVIPTYMAATKSAKAKARSTSSPKLRPVGNSDTCSESYSPCKNKLSLVPSINSEVPRIGRMVTHCGIQQRSPSFKGIPVGPVKSSHVKRDLSLNSDCSLVKWD